MKHEIIDIKDGRQAVIDLPLDITCMNFSFKYYDEELKEERDSHPGYWVVDDAETTPKNFKVAVKEFHKLSTAITYARDIYMKFLREEMRRVKELD